MKSNSGRVSLLMVILCAPLVGLHAQSNYANPYTFSTLAGLASGAGSVDGSAASARFNHPASLSVDTSGGIYVADTNNNTVRKVASDGTVSTFAGLAGIYGSADGTGSAARFASLNGAAVDSAGNVYVADTYNHTIRKITPAGAVTTLAGTAGSSGSADGTGAAARFNSPFSVVVDSAGNVYVADTYNNTIRKITSAGVVTTLAGTVGSSGSANGTGTAAKFYYPTGVAVDGSGNVYVADTYNSTIRKITSAGVVTTLAGTAGAAGSVDASGSAARLNYPFSIAVDGAGNLYAADTYNSTIRKITAAGAVTTLAGLAGTTGSADGSGSAARFYSPAGVAVDGTGNIYVSDSSNDTIRKITSAGAVTTLAGNAVYSSADGVGTAAHFTYPFGVALDGAGNIYVADAGNDTIRKITPVGAVSTFAGAAGVVGSADGTGGAARFYSPNGLTVDAAGNVFVADTYNRTIRKITPAGVVTTLAGTVGSVGLADGTGGAARFSYPAGVAVDASGNIFVADAGNNTVRKVTSAGVVTTFAGTAGSSGSVDGTGSAALFNYPTGVAVDGSGSVYVADAGNNSIRKITSAGVVTTLAGTAGSIGSTDGTGNAARFNYPSGLTVDTAGYIYVVDTRNDTIRKITPAGVVTTLDGTPRFGGTNNGSGSAALFNLPYGVAVDSTGSIYVADTSNNTIRRGVRYVPYDFNGDGHADIQLANSSTGDRGFWLMNGTSFSSWIDLGYVSNDWRMAAAGDFNSDGQTDILWENTTTGDRGFWMMNGTSYASWIDMGYVSTDWRIAASGDFNGDGKPDILWENTVTGDRGIWLMDGTSYAGWVDLGYYSTDWRIAGSGDFNGDGQTDIVWENTVTGDRGFWLMNGTTFSSWVDLGYVSTDWRIVGTGDYNSDGHADFLWENTVTGDRGFWLMNGTSFASWIDWGYVSTDWHLSQ